MSVGGTRLGHPRGHGRRRAQPLGIVDRRPVSSSEALWEFAVAETQNDVRHDRAYSRGLGPGLFERVRTDRRTGRTRADRRRLRSTVVGTRPKYLASLVSLQLSWSTGEIAAREIPGLRVPNLDLFRPRAPSRGLAEFVESLEAEKGDPDLAVAANYRRIRGAFRPGRMRGAPVVIGERSGGPFTIVEGMTRLSVLCSKVTHGERVPARVRVVAGLGARARAWPFY